MCSFDQLENNDQVIMYKNIVTFSFLSSESIDSAQLSQLYEMLKKQMSMKRTNYDHKFIVQEPYEEDFSKTFLFDTTTKRIEGILEKECHNIFPLKDGNIAFNNERKEIVLWNTCTNQLMIKLSMNEQTLNLNCVTDLQWMPQRSYIVSGHIHMICVWNKNTGEHVRTWDYNVDIIEEMKNGKLVTVNATTVSLWNIHSGKRLLFIDTLEYIWCLTEINGNICTGHATGFVRILNSDTGEMLMAIAAHKNSVIGIVHLKNGICATFSTDTFFKKWDLETGRLQTAFKSDFLICQIQQKEGIFFYPWEEKVLIYDPSTMKQTITEIELPGKFVCALYFRVS